MDALKVNIVFFYESINNGGQQTQTYNLTKTIRQLGHNVSWVYLFGNDLKKNNIARDCSFPYSSYMGS